MYKHILTFIFACLVVVKTASGVGLYGFEIETLTGKKMDLPSLKGKMVMFVNIATQCGHTGQLGDMEKIYQKYKDKGFMIVGIPSNDFGSQTPESNKKVGEFCRINYGVTFPITTKTVVKGDQKHPLIKHFLKVSSGREIGWNFEKFLFDRKGKFIEKVYVIGEAYELYYNKSHR